MKIPLNAGFRLLSFHYYVMSFVFYQKQNVRGFIIILGMIMKAVAFESYIINEPVINGFVKKLVIFSDQFTLLAMNST